MKQTEKHFTRQEIEQAKQYIADVYHCSDCWGAMVTEQEMEINLTENRQFINPGDYIPDPGLAPVCAAYWNHLCCLYPN